MTYDELVDETLRMAFPEGAYENLQAVHRSFINEALFDLQLAVPCFNQNHTDTYPHCATYFNCGMTVVPKPEGQILSVYTIDKINPDTGKEDTEADDDWCAKVFYAQVDWCQLKAYSRLCERCSGTNIAAVADAIASNFFGIWRRKRAYPRPTDEGFEALPTLPMGFHYPQASTNAGGRSPSGVWANYRGRIYIAPWIEETETLVIEWNGKKRKWSGSDLVEDDPNFRKAVRLSLQVQHERSFGDDPGKLQRLMYALNGGPDEAGVIPMLIHECNEQNRKRACQEAGVAGMAHAARGIGSNTGPVNLFSNDRRVEYTAECPEGQTGTPVTAVREIGTVGSPFSVADANARAQQEAAEDANDRLVCETASAVYYNEEQEFTATCPAADGDTPAAEGTPVKIVVKARTYSSTVSQEAADDAAADQAEKQATAKLSCTFWNAPQSFTAICGVNESITVTRSVDAHTFSADSQTAADALALAEATRLANEALVLVCVDEVFYNTPYSITSPPRPCPCYVNGHVVGSFTVTITVNIKPGVFSCTGSEGGQICANKKAADMALQLQQQAFSGACYQGVPCGQNKVLVVNFPH